MDPLRLLAPRDHGRAPLPSSPACSRAEFNPAPLGPSAPSPLLALGWLRRSRWPCQRLFPGDTGLQGPLGTPGCAQPAPALGDAAPLPLQHLLLLLFASFWTSAEPPELFCVISRSSPSPSPPLPPPPLAQPPIPAPSSCLHPCPTPRAREGKGEPSPSPGACRQGSSRQGRRKGRGRSSVFAFMMLPKSCPLKENLVPSLHASSSQGRAAGC